MGCETTVNDSGHVEGFTTGRQTSYRSLEHKLIPAKMREKASGMVQKSWKFREWAIMPLDKLGPSLNRTILIHALTASFSQFLIETIDGTTFEQPCPESTNIIS
ncbi:hypothetical protein TNCV_3191 [Trichonephila clavipes]|nr:hypothetical protein TNCV_3191 [Trichonephila clavipes]